jgi:uridine phosphorylase
VAGGFLTLKPLGVHTVLGHLNKPIPPFIIAVGDRRRVWKAGKILRLNNYLLLDEYARKKNEDKAGRVAVGIGVFEKDGFSLPLCVFETQMGCSATQINLREAIYYASLTKSGDGYLYKYDGKTIKSDGIYVVRVGTAAGVNSHDPRKEEIEIGDIAIATSSFGCIGAVIQSTLKKIHFLSDIRESIEKIPLEMRAAKILSLSKDLECIETFCSLSLISAIRQAASTISSRYHLGPNFSKDSLYAELGEEGFAELRDRYDVISTEMEQVVINVLAGEFRQAGINVQSGLVSAIIGAIPGKSFPETEIEKQAAFLAERDSMIIAALALHSIAKGLNS